MSFICGSFKNQQEDDFKFLWPSPPPSRRGSTHKFCCIRNKEHKNPYANRGLDKFEALLHDLEDKKRKIFTQKGSEYISFVRFVYSNSNDVKPIIVWLKHPKTHHYKDHHKPNNFKDTKTSSLPKLQDSIFNHHHHHNHFNHHRRRNSEPPGYVTSVTTRIETKEVQHASSLVDKVTKKIKVDEWKVNWERKLEEWWKPSYNLPLFVILVMVFLAVFGRSLAIICTSIAWYLIPTIDIENRTARQKKMIKSQHSRKPSENKMVSSPKPFFSGPLNVKKTKRMKKLMTL